MNSKSLFPTLAGLALLAAGGCHSDSGAAPGGGYTAKPAPKLSSAIVQAGQEASYFPFSVGSQWTFDTETTIALNGRVGPTQRKEITYRLAKLTPGPDGGQDAAFDVLTDGAVTSNEVWRQNGKGLFQVSSGAPGKIRVLNPPQPVAPFPVTVGQTFKWESTIKDEKGVTLTSSVDGKVDGQQEIDTSMGTFNALAVENTGTVTGTNIKSQLTSTIWLIPNIGIGRFRLATETSATSPDPKFKGKVAHRLSVQTMKLKSYSPKK